MGEFIYKPIVVVGGAASVARAFEIFREVVMARTPDNGLLRYRLSQLGEPTRGANDIASWLVPASGGKDGGSIDAEWEAYRAAWKRKVAEEDIFLCWAELRLNGPGDPRVVQSVWGYDPCHPQGGELP